MGSGSCAGVLSLPHTIRAVDEAPARGAAAPSLPPQLPATCPPGTQPVPGTRAAPVASHTRNSCEEFAAARVYSQRCPSGDAGAGAALALAFPGGITLLGGPRLQQPRPGTMCSPRLCCPHHGLSAVGPKDAREEREKHLSFCSDAVKVQNSRCLRELYYPC